MENGYWTKIEVRIGDPTDHIPHGSKYSLTLHDSYNIRILGYDNAHGTKLKRKNIVPKEAFGIIDMKDKVLSHTSSTIQISELNLV